MKPLISFILIFFVISPARAESIILKTKEEKQFPVQFQAITPRLCGSTTSQQSLESNVSELVEENPH